MKVLTLMFVLLLASSGAAAQTAEAETATLNAVRDWALSHRSAWFVAGMTTGETVTLRCSRCQRDVALVELVTAEHRVLLDCRRNAQSWACTRTSAEDAPLTAARAWALAHRSDWHRDGAEGPPANLRFMTGSGTPYDDALIELLAPQRRIVLECRFRRQAWTCHVIHRSSR